MNTNTDNTNTDNTNTTPAVFEVKDVPQHLVPNEQMRQNFIQNCKDMGMWD